MKEVIWDIEKEIPSSVALLLRKMKIDGKMRKKWFGKRSHWAVAEGANMPSNLDAIAVYQEAQIFMHQAKAGMLAGSCYCLEMSPKQASGLQFGHLKKLDEKLRRIIGIHLYWSTRYLLKTYQYARIS